jgi:hypothetical protein
VAGAVRDVSDPASLKQLATTMRQPGERFDQLEQQTSLGAAFFDRTFEPLGQTILHVARQENDRWPPSYFIYERSSNLVMYIGADFFHGQADHTVLNCIPMNEHFQPLESHTLRL